MKIHSVEWAHAQSLNVGYAYAHMCKFQVYSVLGYLLDSASLNLRLIAKHGMSSSGPFFKRVCT